MIILRLGVKTVDLIVQLWVDLIVQFSHEHPRLSVFLMYYLVSGLLFAAWQLCVDVAFIRRQPEEARKRHWQDTRATVATSFILGFLFLPLAIVTGNLKIRRP